MTPRTSYHHGNLRTALVDAGVRAARSGGEAAVGLNRLASELGVSPSAAYRHFPGGLPDLLVAVGDVGRQELADRISRRIGEAPGSRDAVTAARRRFRASGRAYVEYVLEQPGLFQVSSRHDPTGPGHPDPFALLQRCIDDLVDVGALPRGRRRHAATAAWAAVHGVSLLLTEGSLRHLPPEGREAVVERTLDMVGAGL